MRNRLRNDSTTYRARELRRNASIPEQIIWKRLRLGRRAGVAFRRQVPIGPYFADFFSCRARLVVEIDGESHLNQAEHDRARDRYMTGLGLLVLRFSVSRITVALDEVVALIFDTAVSRIKRIDNRDRKDEERPAPSPSPHDNSWHKSTMAGRGCRGADRP